MDVHNLIVNCATSFLIRQNEDGSFPAGHNGPYYDVELPIRNTSHILILLLKAFYLTGDDRFFKQAKHAAEYIRSDERRPMGANFWSRKTPSRDFTNGLIGPAWIIEALTYAAPYFEELGLRELAEDVFLLHPFNPDKGVWQCVNVDGSHAPVDNTFNHQLWFAAAGNMIDGNPVIEEQVERFMDRLEVNLGIYRNGLIIHHLKTHFRSRIKAKRRLKLMVKDNLRFYRGNAYLDTVINKAIAYHAFNTHGFALLYNRHKTHPFWSSEKFREIISFIESELYSKGLNHYLRDKENEGVALPFSKYGYAYNPPGIEVAFTAQTFDKYFKARADEIVPISLNNQLERTFDWETGFMERNTDDKSTLASRIYEMVYLKNHPLMTNAS